MFPLVGLGLVNDGSAGVVPLVVESVGFQNLDNLRVHKVAVKICPSRLVVVLCADDKPIRLESHRGIDSGEGFVCSYH